MAETLNAAFDSTSDARDAATVAVKVPSYFAGKTVDFISELGAIEVTPDTLARVVINERTGTIVATSTVRISQVAISHGSLTITITQNLGVSQPNSFTQGGTTEVVPSTQTKVSEVRGGFVVLNEAPTVDRLANALNALGVSTREMMSIFQTLKRSGALQAELVIN